MATVETGSPPTITVGDGTSQDVVIEVVRELETQLWMLRASLLAGGV